ncbi:DUF2637 domain-containing protein [Streptomyces sp. NPDC055078]
MYEPHDPYWIPGQATYEPTVDLSPGPYYDGPGDRPYYNSPADGPYDDGHTARERLADVCDVMAVTHDTGLHATDLHATDLDAELAELLSTTEHSTVVVETPHAASLATPPPVPHTNAPHTAPASHRKATLLPASRDGRGGWSWRRLLSLVSVVLTAVIVAAVGILGALASYPALRSLADGVTPPDVAELWPLLIYGPWIAATLSILRARAYRRRIAHSWCVIIFFAGISMALCIIEAPTTPAGITVAGLPPVTVLLCFHQLVRQLDLTPTPPAPSTRHASTARGSHRQRGGR